MKVLDGCHSPELGGGHFGRDKTLLKISERFYWIGMVNDVKEYCKTYVRKLIGKPVFMPLQIANTRSHFYNECTKFSAELHPIPVNVAHNLIGPLPETQKHRRETKYIMTVSCLFSKWPEATALPDKTATGVVVSFFVLHKTWLL